MRVYVVYSLEHPSLAREELSAVLEVEAPEARVVAEAEGLVLLEVGREEAERVFSRTAYVMEWGELLSYGRLEDFESIVEEAFSKTGSRRLSVKSIKSYGEEVLAEKLRKIQSGGGGLVRVVASESLVAAGLPASRIRISRVIKPRARTVTGALDPRISRSLVNLSRLKRGGVFLDPFCGTGNLAIEACEVGALRSVCVDIDKTMCEVSRVNAESLRLAECVEIVRGDARSPPISRATVDSIATDPPYGRSSSTRGDRFESLVARFLEASLEALKSGSYVVYAGPSEARPWLIAEKTGLSVARRLQMFVHGSLVREVVVARVP